jgi:predicted nucleic acid-binding protein
MKFLVDANVLSEPTKPSPDAQVVEWLGSNEPNVVVDAVILGELCVGILSLPRGRRRAALEKWFESVAETIHCLPWDAGTSRRWAILIASLRTKGVTMPLLDSMIAASALRHELVVATRNTRDYRHAGVDVVNPFS